MPHWIQTSDWSDYDSRKPGDESRSYFTCEETWEVDYLVNKIRVFYPDKPEAIVRQAIKSCCGSLQDPRPRSVFIVAVMEKIKSLSTNSNKYTQE